MGERERKIFFLTTNSTHFIYGYMASDIWLRTILIVRKETRCRHIGYSYRLTARVLLYAPSHRQDNTYHGLCYWLERELAQWVHPMKDRSDDPSHHERTLLPRSYISLPTNVTDANVGTWDQLQPLPFIRPSRNVCISDSKNGVITPVVPTCESASTEIDISPETPQKTGSRKSH